MCLPRFVRGQQCLDHGLPHLQTHLFQTLERLWIAHEAGKGFYDVVLDVTVHDITASCVREVVRQEESHLIQSGNVAL